MKERGILALFLFFSMLVALGIALASPGGIQAAPSPSPALQRQPQLEYFTRTLAIGSPDTSSGSYIGWVKVSDNWVGYSQESIGCGHCGLYTTRLAFVNVLTNERKTINSSIWHYQYTSSGAPKGVLAVQMFAPYVVWSQPGPTVPGEGYTYSPGDFDCTICYYNLDTGEGGAVTSLQGLDPNRASIVRVMDLGPGGQALARVEGASDLWAGVIGEPNSTLITTGLAPNSISEAALALFGRYVWISSGTVYINDPSTGTGKQVGSEASDLTSRGLYFFWHTPAGLQVYDGDPTGPSPNPNGRTLIEDVGTDFDVQTTTDLGDIAAWINYEDGGYTLRVANFSVLGGTNILLERAILSEARQVSLSTDKLVFVESIPGEFYPSYQLQLVWLVQPDPAFQQVWSAADGPVASGQVARSWLWGPQANNMGKEQYIEGQRGERLVRYYDKSRMEINNPNGDPNDPYYVTNGLLVTEMIAGEIQTGDNTFVQAVVPSDLPVAGDPRKDNPLTPGYSALAGVSSLHGENQAQNRVGQPVDGAIDVNATVSIDSAHAGLAQYAAYSPQTGHNIPNLFWDYLQGMQGTYGFDWTFVLGYPISEAYWTQMRVSGEDMPVLVQAYQRRVLTYVPDFPAEWRVQMGNVGQHYFEWRYILNR